MPLIPMSHAANSRIRGRTKSGKTLPLLDIAARMTRGDPPFPTASLSMRARGYPLHVKTIQAERSKAAIHASPQANLNNVAFISVMDADGKERTPCFDL